MKNILVAVEFEKKDTKLINHAVRLAEKFDSKVWIVHVTNPDPEFVGYEVGPQYIRDFRGKELKEEHKRLQKIVSKLKEKDIKSDGLLIQGMTIKTILEESKRLKIDLIIMGYHSRGIFSRAFNNNNAVSVIRKSGIPIMVVPLQ